MPTSEQQQPVYVLMGVSGAGKTTIGTQLAKRLGIPFYDGDDFHPQGNVDKMAAGRPLTDSDRAGWLEQLNHLAQGITTKQGGVIACSALKHSYREVLRAGVPRMRFVYLQGDEALIRERLENREGHYAKPELLPSQFEALEPPQTAFTVSVDQEPEKIVEEIALGTALTSFGLVGLGVMGKSLARNLVSKGIKVSLFNRHLEGVEERVAADFVGAFTELADAQAYDQLGPFVDSLARPRKIFLMVSAGPVVDLLIASLKPLLDKGDIIIDGGNSHPNDTQRRITELERDELHFLGCGVSGGERGALEGPAIMPGGPRVAYDQVAPYLELIAAKDKNGKPCCAYMGPGGSGHFVKMVHNGIEYAEMQLLAELYQLQRKSRRPHTATAKFFEQLANGPLAGYLQEITAVIADHREADAFIIDQILDKAGNKGTGNWTTVAMAQLGVPATLIAAALFARYLSARKAERVRAEKAYGLGMDYTTEQLPLDDEQLADAYYAAKLINHHQGFDLLREASREYDWSLDLSEIARVWTNGCIIRSALMEELVGLLRDERPLLLQPVLVNRLKKRLDALDGVVTLGGRRQVALPCFAAAAQYLHGYAEAEGSANMIQAQRDYFGAHTYRRVDKDEAESFHTDWPEA